MNVDENSWDVNQKLKIDINIDDTSSTYNFYINVRNTADYKYSNFFLFIKTTFPDGKTAIDTLECILADISGKWIGKGNDKIIDNRILFKKDAIFPAKGKYVFEIEHAMRDKIISGIKSVGLQIEKNKTR
jgi:gliding motility-associated lipoprotein GldH